MVKSLLISSFHCAQHQNVPVIEPLLKIFICAVQEFTRAVASWERLVIMLQKRFSAIGRKSKQGSPAFGLGCFLIKQLHLHPVTGYRPKNTM